MTGTLNTWRDVGPPCGGSLEREGAGTADAGRRGPAYNNWESGLQTKPHLGRFINEIGEFAPNRRCAHSDCPDAEKLDKNAVLDQIMTRKRVGCE